LKGVKSIRNFIFLFDNLQFYALLSAKFLPAAGPGAGLNERVSISG